MYIASNGNNLHEKSNLVFWGKMRNTINLLSAEFTNREFPVAMYLDHLIEVDSDKFVIMTK